MFNLLTHLLLIINDARVDC